MQTRDFPLQVKELSEAGEIVGLAAAFGSVDNGGDRILPGAFTATLAEHKARGTTPAMLLGHNLQRPIGKWHELRETDAGLLAKGKLTLGCQDGAEAYALARDGALTGLSIGYQPEAKSYENGVRNLTAVKLFEVSLVSVPMNDATHIQLVKTIEGVRDIEHMLREGGVSSRQAKAAANAAWRSISARLDDDETERALAILERATAKLTDTGGTY